MGRGIHRFVVTLGPKVVKVRAQSASLRGQAYTVGSVSVPVVGEGGGALKVAVAKGISLLYPVKADTTSY